ncbi:Rab-like protein 3 [Trichinella pseudospiralis]|uniref:Rab-like protein 3 n=2 Tax=Trichinella pseudospiralis TaxID=6337 RepID=A0A0V1IUD1_TRIPS|nr:Rab-like protein 3 [Trichinella pseudospiralis]
MTNKTVYPGSFLLNELKPLDMHPILSTIFVLIGIISLICHGFVFCLLCAKRNFDYEQSMIFGYSINQILDAIRFTIRGLRYKVMNNWVYIPFVPVIECLTTNFELPLVSFNHFSKACITTVLTFSCLFMLFKQNSLKLQHFMKWIIVFLYIFCTLTTAGILIYIVLTKGDDKMMQICPHSELFPQSYRNLRTYFNSIFYNVDVVVIFFIILYSNVHRKAVQMEERIQYKERTHAIYRIIIFAITDILFHPKFLLIYIPLINLSHNVIYVLLLMESLCSSFYMIIYCFLNSQIKAFMKELCNSGMESVKIIVVGESGCGKTSFVQALLGSPTADPPATLGCSVDVTLYQYAPSVEKQLYFIELWDISGSSCYEDIRKMFYYNVDGIVFVYSLADGKSSERAVNWIVEVLTRCEKISKQPILFDREQYAIEEKPLLVVGTNFDRKDDVLHHNIKQPVVSNFKSYFDSESETVLLNCRLRIIPRSISENQIHRFFDRVIEKKFRLQRLFLYSPIVGTPSTAKTLLKKHRPPAEIIYRR